MRRLVEKTQQKFAEGVLFVKHSKVARYPYPLILTRTSTEFCCAFLDVDTTCLTQFVFAYGKLVFSLFGRVCVYVCVFGRVRGGAVD